MDPLIFGHLNRIFGRAAVIGAAFMSHPVLCLWWLLLFLWADPAPTQREYIWMATTLKSALVFLSPNDRHVVFRLDRKFFKSFPWKQNKTKKKLFQEGEKSLGRTAWARIYPSCVLSIPASALFFSVEILKLKQLSCEKKGEKMCISELSANLQHAENNSWAQDACSELENFQAKCILQSHGTSFVLATQLMLRGNWKLSHKSWVHLQVYFSWLQQ